MIGVPGVGIETTTARRAEWWRARREGARKRVLSVPAMSLRATVSDATVVRLCIAESLVSGWTQFGELKPGTRIIANASVRNGSRNRHVQSKEFLPLHRSGTSGRQNGGDEALTESSRDYDIDFHSAIRDQRRRARCGGFLPAFEARLVG